MASHTRPLAIVTGASSGIGYELAKCCAEHGFDLLIAADQPSINDAAQDFHALGVAVEAIEADLATLEGVDKLYAATGYALKAGQLMLCSPTRDMAWGTAFSTRTSMPCATSLIRTSPAPSI